MEDKLRAHINMLRTQYPLFAAAKCPEPMALSETALKPNEWVLSYDVTDSGVIVYLTKGREIVKGIFKPFPRKELDELVRRFREPFEQVTPANFTDKLRSFDFGSGKKLSDLLLSDILSHLPHGAPVIVVPDDSLGVLPFEMLVLNEGGRVVTDKAIPSVSGAEFLGDRNPISYYQSISALTLARTLGSKTGKGSRLLVMADAVFKPEDRRSQESKQTVKLAGVQAEIYRNLMVAMEEGKSGNFRIERLSLTANLAKGLAQMFRKRADVFTGLDASKEKFMGEVAPHLSKYDKIVFATQGYFGNDLPGIMEPVLILSLVPPGTDGYLRMSEVMSLKTSAEMVALTACQSGLGRRISGEGVMGMGRAFQYAGAQSVLMSLWNVAESSSVDLAEHFFKHLKEGKGKLEALTLARAEIRRAGYDHPFFWAPFILVGEVGEAGEAPERPVPQRVVSLPPLKKERPSRVTKRLEKQVKQDSDLNEELFKAAKTGDESTVKRLLAGGVDISCKDK